MNKYLLATDSLEFEQRVRAAFSGKLNGQLERWSDDDLHVGGTERSLAALASLGSQVVVFGPDVPIEDALVAARRIDKEQPEISVVITIDPTPELWEQALHAGVRGILAPDASDKELRAELERAAASASDRKARIPPAPADGASVPGKVITVLAPKGGSGKTLLATNLAVGLAQHHPGQVVLVDLDLQFGDVTNALSLTPNHGIADAARATGPLDAGTVKVFLTPRGDDLYVLCAPDEPAQGEEISAERVEEAIRILSLDFRYVVVDTAAGLSEYTLSAIEHSTDLVFICDLAVASVRGLRKVLNALDRLEISKPTRHMVLNRADSKVGLHPNEVTSTLGGKIHIKLPSSRTAPLSMNQGQPVLESAPKSSIAKQLQEVVGRFTEVPAHQKRRLKR